jgi:glycosyltransferase involved in cell wall biosynthesis
LEFARTALFLKQKHRIPVVYTCHSLISMESGSRSYRSKLQHELIRQANKVVVPSMWLKREIQRRYSGVAFKIKVIPNGVSSFSQGTRAPSHQLLFVGRLVRSKGIEPLIGSIARLSIIGKGSSSYRGRLAAIAKAKRVLSNIRWLGSLPHSRVQRLYTSYGAVVVPSTQESFCLVALEAMANGVPLVASRAGGLKEFVNSNNAQIITAVESRAISRAIEAMWNNPGRTRQRVANAKLVARRYQWRRIAGLYKMLFKTGR